MKILITGGAGYVGTVLSYQLENIADIEEIIIYDNLHRGNYNLFIGSSKLKKKLSFVAGDILDTRKLKQALEGVDIVYHLAATVTTPFADQDPHFFEQINHWGTAELVNAVEKSGVKKFIYLSSASVYGDTAEEVDINTPANPITFYSISKMRGEEHVSRLSELKIDTYIFRCANVYGYSKSMRFNSVINRFMFNANFTNRITINGNGEQQRSFIHIEKAASTLASLVNTNLVGGKYNLTENILSINDIADTLKEVYSNLEYLYINQQLNLHQLKLKPDPVVNAMSNTKTPSLKESLEIFKKAFTF